MGILMIDSALNSNSQGITILFGWLSIMCLLPGLYWPFTSLTKSHKKDPLLDNLPYSDTSKVSDIPVIGKFNSSIGNSKL